MVIQTFKTRPYIEIDGNIKILTYHNLRHSICFSETTVCWTSMLPKLRSANYLGKPLPRRRWIPPDNNSLSISFSTILLIFSIQHLLKQIELWQAAIENSELHSNTTQTTIMRLYVVATVGTFILSFPLWSCFKCLYCQSYISLILKCIMDLYTVLTHLSFGSGCNQWLDDIIIMSLNKYNIAI